MNLKAVQTYQSVRFDGKQETYFDTAAAKNQSKLTMTFDKDLVTITNERDEILVPTTNIAYLVAEAGKGPSDLQKRGKLTDVDHTKAPKTK